jgi:hypothetical protein
MKDSRIKISTLIENQIPKYLRESSPLLIDFLRQYYISVESKGQVLDVLENIDQYINIDTLTRFEKTTKLSNNISFFDDSIQVESTLGFPDSYGLIKINDEIISYESKTQDTFTNCFRGFSGIESYGDSSFEKNVFFKQTEASEHFNGDVVENLSVLFLSEFLGKIKKQILPGFEDRTLSTNLNENIFIKQSKDFYSSKGNKSSFKILFKALYGEKVEVIRPSEFLIEPSKSNYLITKDIVVEAIQGNLEELINQTVIQNEDEYFPKSSATVTRIEKIFRNTKEYFVLSLDFGYDRDLETRGSFTGDFQIHPKTKVIGNVISGQNYIDVDSTSGFPNSGVLVVNRSGITFNIQYRSKSLNQFFECENVPIIEDGLDIRLDTYAFGISPFSGEEIQFRISGVLSNLNISEDTILSDVGDTIRIVSPGKIIDDIRAKNWLYNISVTYTISNILSSGLITTFDDHNFIPGDSVSIESSNVSLPFNSNVVEVRSKNEIVINPPLVNIEDGVLYKIKRKILKSKFRNYPEISNLNSNVQKVYEKIEDNSIYVTSPSIPNYFNGELTISDRSSLINGFQTDNQITFSNVHSFLTGDVVLYSYGSSGLNLNISEGLYYVKKVNNTTIKLYKSHEDILFDRFLSFSSNIGVVNNKITPFSLSSKKLTTQKLVRKIDNPKFSLNLNETRFGSTGILLNGVEISNYKSNDFIYYGPIENVSVASDLEDYDVINPNIVEILDDNGVGVGASVTLHVTGGLKKVNILNAGFDYINKPKINIIGGNGSGYKLDVNLINFTHKLNFNSENINSLNLQNNIITFSKNHLFRDIEEVVYKSNEKNTIGGLVDFSTYYLKSISSNSIQLYSTEQDALVGINTISFSSLGQGIHTIESVIKKKRISSINVIDSGNNYSNKKIVVRSIDINDKKNTIFAKNHGYKNKEIIHYSSTEEEIGGLNAGNYYVKVINENEFNLIEIIENSDNDIDFNFINNTIVNFENKGSGEHIFNYPEITALVNGITGVNTFSSEESQAKIQPIFRGKIKNVFIVSSGANYGTSDIINFERQPNFNLIEGSGAILNPIILNGRIEEVLILNGGKNYNTPPEIKIIGNGNGAVLTPMIEDGKIKQILIVNRGNGYIKDSTNIVVETNNLNVNTKLRFKIKSWNINEYFKLLQFNALSQNQSLLTPPLNEDYGLQYKHIALPDILRRILFISKIIENEEYYISDKDNDNQSNPNLIVHSPIVGWAYDGNPIYGPYGFDTPIGGIIRRMESGYTLSTANLQNRPNYSPGFFIEDYVFTDSGDLDIHNGRFCVTPEFPNGVYAYFCTLDEQFKPKFPYVIGNFYKSSPIKFNFDKNSNQDIFNINNENLIRNSNPYKFLSKNSNYEYLIDPNQIKNQNSKVSSITRGSIDFIDIISPGDNYKIGESIIIETLEDDTGFGAAAQINEVLGKEVNSINTEIKIINNVQFSNSIIFNETIAIAENPHNLNNRDFITIKNFDVDDIFREEKFYRINVIPTELTLNEDVGNESGISYFSVNGNLDYPFIIEDDIFVINGEEIKILSVDLDSRRIKVLRGNNPTEHYKNNVLAENSRKFYFNEVLDKNYKINRKYYFNPEETLGVGTISGVSIGTTITFSNPGVGITQVFIPTKSLYFANHNLKTGDKLIYEKNGGVGIKVSNDGLDEFTLDDNDLLYVAKISDNLIGLSTNRVALSPQGNFVGIGTTANILFFKDFGEGLNHSFTTDYNENLTRNVNNIKSILTTKSEHFLKINDTINLDLKSSQTQTFILFYDFNSRNLAINKTIVESVNNNILTISNHNFTKGQKVLFNSSSLLDNSENEILDGEKYYVLPLNSNELKLSKTYFGSFNNQDIVNIVLDSAYDPFDLDNGLFLSLVNPPIEIFKNNNIVFDLSDQSLEGFDFNIFEDDVYNNIFYGFDGFSVSKNGIPGTINANLILNIKESKIPKLYYTLTIPDKNNIFFEKLEYYSDNLNVINNNTLIIKDSIYSGEKTISGIGTNYFEFNLSNMPESLNYDNKIDSIIKYTTKSNNAFGPISKIKIISNGRNYKKLPIIKEISTKFGKGAFLKAGTNSIGKIQKIIVEDIGFDYFSDNSLRPFSKIPEILRVNPLSTIDEIKVISFGEQYNITPDLVLIDGITGKIVDDVILDFNFDSNFVSILKNTNGINDITPTIIPINNTNGINISLIEFNSSNNSLDIFLNASYSEIINFPFSKVVAKLLNNIEAFTTEIFVDDSSNIPESSLIKIFNPEGSSITEEVLYVKEINNNKLTVERGFFGTEIPNTPFKYEPGFYVLLLEKEVLIENVKILENSGQEYNSRNYEYKLYKIKQISPQLGGENPFISVDFSDIINDGNLFGTYDVNSSFGKVVAQSYFPIFEISLKKNIFSIGETVISGNKSGIVEFWDSKNELLKVNTIDNFELNAIITGKSSGYNGIIVDKFKFESYYDIDSSSIVIRSWQDSVGFLNEDLQRIHNNEYYQYFSYSLKSIIQYNDWESAVSSLNHTSGFKKFSDLDIEIKNPTYTSEDDIEIPYVGIVTNQDKGNVTSLANIDSFSKFNCIYDYDLVSENSDIIDSKLISDQIYFESKELLDYFDCIGNRVLSIDDISDQFRSQERLNVVNRFNL